MQRASVSCILRGREALFIRRTQRSADKWSGQVAFPGGRQEPKDGKDDLITCIREVKEEQGGKVFRNPFNRERYTGPDCKLFCF